MKKYVVITHWANIRVTAAKFADDHEGRVVFTGEDGGVVAVFYEKDLTAVLDSCACSDH